ncbi:short-chain dehydrogenase/reductase SDR, partial [Roridomyces roridus]
RTFSKAGYSVVLLARRQGSLDALTAELKGSGGDAASFCMPSYTPKDFTSTFSAIRSHFPDSKYSLRLASRAPFLQVTPEEVQESLDTNVSAVQFKQNTVDAENPARGTLIFTGATASTRGNAMTSAFSIGKFGARALSQSLAKEFGKNDIHAIIDGQIMTGSALSNGNPPSGLSPESIAQSYLYRVNQHKSAWTWELDLRPAHEKW